ncbi:MAG: type IV pilus modification protein PilV [Dokdonella sp.]|jgi:type IV pilus assembly protein PilV|uniref:type IV pilus modification protein PilV n=1 Tax=Dokdonella sp. TaxID=2291710 RepID=UPI002CD7DAD7|nr:type IV pilus modification protein PilV [Dokdonella sp.]HOX72176.1 type IV pilus modification protein PilV [Dokdonella sp.]HPG95384.1 type IV pilus modification protein PilV [Dokdonella sp.]HPN79499.1 type IV pilus modification protein PilV [Dokdonella sp.]
MNSSIRRRGFTLLEVLIALLILSFGLLGLAALQAYSVKANQSANLRSQATDLANMLMDNIRSNRINLGSYYADSYEEVTCGSTPTTSSPAAHDLDVWRIMVNCQLPQGRGAVAPISANEVAVCIRWSDARWESDSGTSEGKCTEDAETFGARLADDGPGAGTDGQVSVFVVSSRM